jgi:hypothetical protein
VRAASSSAAHYIGACGVSHGVVTVQPAWGSRACTYWAPSRSSGSRVAPPPRTCMRTADLSQRIHTHNVVSRRPASASVYATAYWSSSSSSYPLLLLLPLPPPPPPSSPSSPSPSPRSRARASSSSRGRRARGTSTSSSSSILVPLPPPPCSAFLSSPSRLRHSKGTSGSSSSSSSSWPSPSPPSSPPLLLLPSLLLPSESFTGAAWPWMRGTHAGSVSATRRARTSRLLCIIHHNIIVKGTTVRSAHRVKGCRPLSHAAQCTLASPASVCGWTSALSPAYPHAAAGGPPPTACPVPGRDTSMNV